jgi:hypothetical protein
MKYLFGFNCLLIQLVLFFTCDSSYQIDKYNNQEIKCAELRAGQKGFIQLVNNNEPGEPLVVNGIYSSSGRDEDARIKGTVYTNEIGCFKIKTILPGDYPGQKNSRHLHYVINAKGYMEKKSLLFFKGFTTPNITGQGPLIGLDIRKDANGAWIGSTDFIWKKVENE